MFPTEDSGSHARNNRPSSACFPFLCKSTLAQLKMLAMRKQKHLQARFLLPCTDAALLVLQRWAAPASSPTLIFRFCLCSGCSFEGHRGLSGFVQFSAYRLSSTRFVALGLSALALHDIKEAQHCL